MSFRCLWLRTISWLMGAEALVNNHCNQQWGLFKTISNHCFVLVIDWRMSAHEQLFWRYLADNRFEWFNCAFVPTPRPQQRLLQGLTSIKARYMFSKCVIAWRHIVFRLQLVASHSELGWHWSVHEQSCELTSHVATTLRRLCKRQSPPWASSGNFPGRSTIFSQKPTFFVFAQKGENRQFLQIFGS